MKKIWSVSLIFIIAILATYISLPEKFTPIKSGFTLHLGLDLAGGSHLVFETDLDKIPEGQKMDAVSSVRDVIEKRVNLFGVSEPSVTTSKYEGRDRIVVELPGITNTSDAVNLIGKTAQLQFSELSEATVKGSATPSSELKPTNLTGADLNKASVVFDSQTGKPSISLVFTKEGATKFGEITGRNIGKPLPIVLDNQIISAPTVQGKIDSTDAQITGNFTLDEAKNLVVQLNAGALPVPVKLIEERTVGATLGADSIKKSVIAGLVGITMVSIFMILSYGFLGFVAVIGLGIFAVISLSLYKMIPITITLPGIAGFMLSVGMAVDSNILIFERFKEEKQKRNLSDALEVSFGRAWDSIRDANIATLVTAFILSNPLEWQFLHVSGPVRGFAFTLALGIFISLFTGVFVTRNLLRFFVREEKRK